MPRGKKNWFNLTVLALIGMLVLVFVMTQNKTRGYDYSPVAVRQ